MSNASRTQSRADYNKYSNPARYQPRVVDYKGHQFVVDDKPFFINPFMRVPKEERIRYKEERAAAAAAKADAKAKANPKHEDRKYHPGDKPFFLNPFRRVFSQQQKKKKPAAGSVHPDDAGRDPKVRTRRYFLHSPVMSFEVSLEYSFCLTVHIENIPHPPTTLPQFQKERKLLTLFVE